MMQNNKLKNYLAVTAGVGCGASMADAATTLSLYAEGARDTTASGALVSGPVPPISANMYSNSYNGQPKENARMTASPSVQGTRWSYPVQEGDASPAISNGWSSSLSVRSTYFSYGAPQRGAEAGGNYYFMDLGAPSSEFGQPANWDTVALFDFDFAGGGSIIGIAHDPAGGLTLESVQAAGLVMGPPVPEPSSLTLLALGAAGVAARRRRKKAA